MKHASGVPFEGQRFTGLYHIECCRSELFKYFLAEWWFPRIIVFGPCGFNLDIHPEI